MFRNLSLLAAVLLMATGVSAPAAPLAHMVYFSLAEPSDANRDALIAACHKRLAGHDGVLHFSVGVVAEGLDRPVNDRAFDVALHLVFDSRAAHDKYQTHPRHLAFVNEAQALWSSVRVFDADLVEASAAPATEGVPADQSDKPE